MKVTVKKVFTTEEGTLWKTVVSQGHQYFTIREDFNKDGCLWFAKMFRKALKAHDLEAR